MARQTPRRKEHHVDSDRIVRTREARGEYFRRRRDPAQAPGVDGEIQIFDAVAPFDLDEGEGAAAPRDQVDLARRYPQPLAQYPPAVEAQPPGGARSEEHTSELQSLMRISYAVFCLKNKKDQKTNK